MTKELAAVLKLQVVTLPFLARVAGLVQTVENETFVEDTNAKIIQRFPVSYDVLGAENCATGMEQDLQPDSSKGSILYFEDFGSQVIQVKTSYTDFTSQLRVICWLNKQRLGVEQYSEISGYCITALLQRLCNNNPKNAGIFNRLIVTAQSIPQQNAALFSRYTYDEKIRQYLRPPYEFFGIDLLCKYRVAADCISKITFTSPAVC